MHTFDALVGGLEVRLQVLGTRFILSELRVRNANLTAASTGTPCVCQLQYIGFAAEVSVVEFDTATDAHAAVLRTRHDNHLVQCTGRVKRLCLTERRVVRRSCDNTQRQTMIIKSKCLPLLLYGLEVCPLTVSDLRSLDFVINRFFMKLFCTNVMDTVKICQDYFNFELPSSIIAKRRETFLACCVTLFLLVKLVKT